MLSKMNFPMSVIPNFVIFSNFYIHLVMLLITIVIFQFMGFYISEYYLQLLYFIFALFCLLFSISLVTSTLSTIFRDFLILLHFTFGLFLCVWVVLWRFPFVEDDPFLVRLLTVI